MAPSTGAGGTPAPSQQVESIIKDLLSGRLEQAAIAINGINHASEHDLEQYTPRTPERVPRLPTIDPGQSDAPDGLASTLSALEKATRLLASNHARSSDEQGNAEKVKFTQFKNAGNEPGSTPIESILWTWETEFDSAGYQPKVSRVIGLMVPGGNRAHGRTHIDP